MTDRERLEEMNKLKNIINSLDDSADADDFHKFVDTCQINYEEGVFNEILRFMQSQAERVQELEEKHKEYVSFTESNNYNMDVEFEKLYKQNKRYRESLEWIKELSEHNEYEDTLNQILLKAVEALEGEEC